MSTALRGDASRDTSGGVEARSLSRRAVAICGLVAILLATAVYLPILSYMVAYWRIAPDYSHGFIVVPLAFYFALERRRKLELAPLRGDWLGVVPLFLGALSLAIGRLGVEQLSMRTGFVLTLHGLVLLIYGRAVYKILFFPLCFLFLMIPLPQSLANQITFPLQLTAASWAVESLHWVGVPALLEGNIIHLASAELFVDEACSGLRSVMALITLGVVFAYFFRKTLPERIIIVLSAIPIAIFVNAVRVALTGVLTHRWGIEAAGGFIHDFQGFITFGLAFAILLLEARLLAAVWPQPAAPVRAARGTS